MCALVILLEAPTSNGMVPFRRYQKRVSNIIDDVLEWSPTLAISGMMDKTTFGNATESSHSTFETGRPAGTAEEATTHHVNSDAGNAKVTSDDVEYEEIVDRGGKHTEADHHTQNGSNSH